jgi:hypothetical protein
LHIKAELMHVDRANQVTVALEAASAADPVSLPGLLFMPTAGTLTRCSSFRASGARDVSSFGFVGQIGDVFAIFPQGHALVVVPAMISIADTRGIADEEGSDCVGDTEIDDFPGRLMALVTNLSGIALAHFVLGLLQFFQRREYLLQRACFLASCQSLLYCQRISLPWPRNSLAGPCGTQPPVCDWSSFSFIPTG